MKIFQTVNLNGQEITVNKRVSAVTAMQAHQFYNQLSGRRVFAEIEGGNVNLQLDLLQANNPNYFGLIEMLRYLYNEVEPSLNQLEEKHENYLLTSN